MACHFSEFFVIGLDGESTEEFLSHRSDAVHCPRALGAQVAGFVGTAETGRFDEAADPEPHQAWRISL